MEAENGRQRGEESAVNDLHPTEKVKYTAHDMRERLRAYHEGPEWVLQFEVGNGTGGNVKSHADAVAMSIWPSRGYRIIGYEIKVSRNDWLREMKQPQKADVVAKWCDAWFLVAPADIVNEAEIPESWGWMVPAAKSLRIKKQPAIVKAQDVNRAFIAAMLRRNHGEMDTLVADKVRKLREKDHEENRKQVEQTLKNRLYDYEKLKEAVKAFEEQSGLRIHDRYRPDPNLGKKLKVIEALGDNEWDGIPAIVSRTRRAMNELEDAYLHLTGTNIEKDHDT